MACAADRGIHNCALAPAAGGHAPPSAARPWPALRPRYVTAAVRALTVALLLHEAQHQPFPCVGRGLGLVAVCRCNPERMLPRRACSRGAQPGFPGMGGRHHRDPARQNSHLADLRQPRRCPPQARMVRAQRARPAPCRRVRGALSGMPDRPGTTAIRTRVAGIKKTLPDDTRAGEAACTRAPGARPVAGCSPTTPPITSGTHGGARRSGRPAGSSLHGIDDIYKYMSRPEAWRRPAFRRAEADTSWPPPPPPPRARSPVTPRVPML